MRHTLAILLLCAACSSGGHKPAPRPDPAQMTQDEFARERALFFGNGSVAEIQPDE